MTVLSSPRQRPPSPPHISLSGVSHSFLLLVAASGAGVCVSCVYVYMTMFQVAHVRQAVHLSTSLVLSRPYSLQDSQVDSLRPIRTHTQGPLCDRHRRTIGLFGFKHAIQQNWFGNMVSQASCYNTGDGGRRYNRPYPPPPPSYMGYHDRSRFHPSSHDGRSQVTMTDSQLDLDSPQQRKRIAVAVRCSSWFLLIQPLFIDPWSH